MNLPVSFARHPHPLPEPSTVTDEVSSFAPVGFDTAANSVDRPLVYLLDDRDFFASQFSLSHELHDDTLIMKSTLAEL